MINVHANKRILFILKRHNYGPSYGLLNSCGYISEALRRNGIESKSVEVTDNNDIDREVSQYQPTHVIIEALWVVPVTIIWQHRDRGLLRRFRLAVSVEIGEPMFVPGLRDARAGEATSPALRPSEEVAAFAEFAHGRIQGMIDRSMASR